MELSFRERFSRFILVVGVVGAALMVGLIYMRLTDETFTLVLGIGIALAVLVVLLAIIGGILYLLIRGMEARAALKSGRAPSYGNQPPVLIVNPGAQQQALPSLDLDQPVYGYPGRRRSREFTVIGED
jgi:hypothetical protein